MQVRFILSAFLVLSAVAFPQESQLRVLATTEDQETVDDRTRREFEGVDPDITPFVELGFEEIEWKVGDGNGERKTILDNLLAPEYRKRTGRDLPSFPNFDYSVRNYTGGNFNDVLVSSRLPGDCDANGCKIIVFKFTGNEWKVVGRFQAITLLHRYEGPESTSEFVAVGDDVSPTALYRWNGTAFEEK